MWVVDKVDSSGELFVPKMEVNGLRIDMVLVLMSRMVSCMIFCFDYFE